VIEAAPCLYSGRLIGEKSAGLGALPASVLADLTGISVGGAERWSQWAKRDSAAYVGQHTVETEEASAARNLPI
jgi:hypothetical protein